LNRLGVFYLFLSATVLPDWRCWEVFKFIYLFNSKRFIYLLNSFYVSSWKYNNNNTNNTTNNNNNSNNNKTITIITLILIRITIIITELKTERVSRARLPLNIAASRLWWTKKGDAGVEGAWGFIGGLLVRAPIKRGRRDAGRNFPRLLVETYKPNMTYIRGVVKPNVQVFLWLMIAQCYNFPNMMQYLNVLSF
jgi:hypothetical protein